MICISSLRPFHAWEINKRKSSLCHMKIRIVSPCLYCIHDLRCTRGSVFPYGALLGRVLAVAVTNMLAREDRWCVPFLETIKEALHAIKHASAHPFLIGFKRQTLEHSTINLCSKTLCHMKWTSSQITQVICCSSPFGSWGTTPSKML